VVSNLVKKPRTTATQLNLSTEETDFLKNNEMCRFATASRKGEPHVVPVSYVWDRGYAYIVTDYGTRKLKNLRENPQAAILVDSGGTRKLLLISGPVEIIEKGEEYRRLYKLFYSKLDWVKRDPWKEGEAPFVKITPTFKTGWGLKQVQRQ
jgi:nitroimidazol reductase NimA-like FMN-containing flavoprotein (pyridoxamine 5'-phosphate oxidase superfamily)